jgi:hypothetical protein
VHKTDLQGGIGCLERLWMGGGHWEVRTKGNAVEEGLFLNFGGDEVSQPINP